MADLASGQRRHRPARRECQLRRRRDPARRRVAHRARRAHRNSRHQRRRPNRRSSNSSTARWSRRAVASSAARPSSSRPSTSSSANLSAVAHQRVSAVIAEKRTTYVTGGKGAHAGAAARAHGLHLGATLDPGQRPLGRPKAPPAAVVDPPRRAQTCSSWTSPPTTWIPTCSAAIERPARLVARHARRREPRPVPAGARDRQPVRHPRRSACGTCRSGVDEISAPRGIRRGAHGCAGCGARDRGLRHRGERSIRSPGADLANCREPRSATPRRSLPLRIARSPSCRGKIDALHVELAEHDAADFEGLGVLHERVRALETERDAVETRWLELGEDARLRPRHEAPCTLRATPQSASPSPPLVRPRCRLCPCAATTVEPRRTACRAITRLCSCSRASCCAPDRRVTPVSLLSRIPLRSSQTVAALRKPAHPHP